MADQLWVTYITTGNGICLFSTTPEAESSFALPDGSEGGAPLFQTPSATPAIALFNNQLYCAFISNDPSNRILICNSTPDGQTWTLNASDTGQTSPMSPSLAVFNGRLYLAFISNDSRNAVCSTSDGSNWSGATYINQSSWAAPSLAVYENQLFVAFVAANSGLNALVCASVDGVHWSPNYDVGAICPFQPSLAVYKGLLYLACTTNANGQQIVICTSVDGRVWEGRALNEWSSFGPSLAVWNDKLWLAFASSVPAYGAYPIRTCIFDGNSWTQSAEAYYLGPSYRACPIATAPYAYPQIGSFFWE